MASIVKSGNKYYVQFYNKNKTPKRKQIPTETRSFSTARKIAKRLEAEYLLGSYDPWVVEVIEYPTYTLLSEILELYIEEKSKTNWSKTTINTNGQLFNKISRNIGHLQLNELTVKPFNQFINAGKKAHATRVGYKAKLTSFLKWATSHGYVQIETPISLTINTASSTQEQSINYFKERTYHKSHRKIRRSKVPTFKHQDPGEQRSLPLISGLF